MSSPLTPVMSGMPLPPDIVVSSLALKSPPISCGFSAGLVKCFTASSSTALLRPPPQIHIDSDESSPSPEPEPTAGRGETTDRCTGHPEKTELNHPSTSQFHCSYLSSFGMTSIEGSRSHGAARHRARPARSATTAAISGHPGAAAPPPGPLHGQGRGEYGEAQPLRQGPAGEGGYRQSRTEHVSGTGRVDDVHGQSRRGRLLTGRAVHRDRTVPSPRVTTASGTRSAIRDRAAVGVSVRV